MKRGALIVMVMVVAVTLMMGVGCSTSTTVEPEPVVIPVMDRHRPSRGTEGPPRSGGFVREAVFRSEPNHRTAILTVVTADVRCLPE